MESACQFSQLAATAASPDLAADAVHLISLYLTPYDQITFWTERSLQ